MISASPSSWTHSTRSVRTRPYKLLVLFLGTLISASRCAEVRAPGEGGGDGSSSGEGLPAAATGPSASSSGSGGSSPGFRSGEPARAGSSLGRPLLSIPEDGATEETTMEDADGTDRFGQVLCADEDRVRDPGTSASCSDKCGTLVF